MTIIQFLKLLKKNILILLMVPTILASLVFYATRNEVKNYSSNATVYTGVGSGLSIDNPNSSRLDYFGSKMEFDNILNLFKARETQKDVLIRLFAQGLILDSWDPQFISRVNYKKLHDKTPQYIKDLVRQNHDTARVKINNAPLVMVDTSLFENKSIAHKSQYYTVSQGDDLLSVSESHSVLVSELMDWNRLTKVRLDVGQRIIVEKIPMLIYEDKSGIMDTTELFVPDTSFFVRANIDEVEFESSVQRLKAYGEQNDTNYIYKLLNYTHPFYSYKAMKGITVKRIQGSGLVDVGFKTSDPGLCQQTIMFLINAFENNYSLLFENQSDHIIGYFEKRVAESSANLQAAENRLLEFNQDNNIINYYEQTRHISEQKEMLDSRYNDVKMKFTAADSVLRQLEKQLESQQGVSMYNAKLLEYRNRLSEITYQIAINELNDSKDPKAVAAIGDLQAESADLKKKIKQDINSVFGLQFSPEGVKSDDILTSWLMKTIEYEESKAKLAALYERKKEFQKTYETFAPLGAQLSRIEREIDVYEQQYLSLLHSLNQAKLKQQNLAFKSNIKIVDPAYFPLTPEGSKRKLFIVAAGLVGFMMVLFSILVLEYFDDTVKTPKRASKLTGLQLFSAYPKIVKKKKGINYEYIQNRLLELGAQNLIKIRDEHKLNNNDGPIKLVLFSTLMTDGKSLIADRFSEILREFDYEVLNLNYNLPTYRAEFIHQTSEHEMNKTYKIGKGFFGVKSFSELLGQMEPENIETDHSKLDYIILELPSIINHAYSPELVRDADIGLMLVRANRTWQGADINALKSMSEFLKIKPYVFLNGANPELLQDLIGEIPRKRSRIRRMLKKAIRLQFFERNQIKK